MSFIHDIDEIVAENHNHLLGIHATWRRVRTGDVLTITNGFPFKSEHFTKLRGKPLLRIRDILKGETETYYDGPPVEGYWVEPGDLVVGMDGDFNCRLWSGRRVLLNQRVCRLQPDERFYSLRFLSYALPGYLQAINQRTSSLTVKHLSSRTIADLPLPLPARQEQDRIVAKLDELFSRVEKGEENLKRVQALVKRYRQAVLKAAVTGELTRDWRARNAGEGESGAELLKRILAARRAAWEKAELKKMNAKGKRPKDDKWKQKYKEPEAPDTTNLPKLPESWCWASAEQICEFITKGTTPPDSAAPLRTGDVPFIKVQHLSGTGKFHFLESPSFVSLATHNGLLARSRVFPGDVLMNIVGPPLGQVSVVPSTYPEWNINQAIAIFRAIVPLSQNYLKVCLLCRPVLMQALCRAKATAGQVNLTLEVCRDLAVPVPPLAEQAEVVEAVEGQLSVIEHLEADIEANLKSAQGLRRVILRDALTGKLVLQDPNDEPAFALLERIAVERAEIDKARPKRSRFKRAVEASAQGNPL